MVSIEEIPQVPEKQEPEQQQEDEKSTGLKINGGNGANMPNYEWTQTLQEVEIRIPIPKGTKSRFINIKITKSHIVAGLKNEKPILDDDLWKPITDSVWTIEDRSEIVIVLDKKNTMEWWACVGKNEPQIDTKAIVPPNSNMSDLDPETRKTVEKMMYNQYAKQAGKPTTEEIERKQTMDAMLKNNPELAEQLKMMQQQQQ